MVVVVVGGKSARRDEAFRKPDSEGGPEIEALKGSRLCRGQS